MASSITEVVGQFQANMGSELEVLTDASDERFIEYAKRWTDIDRKTPAAIVLPESEEQIQKTVYSGARNFKAHVKLSGSR
jgi:hypothetical protein